MLVTLKEILKIAKERDIAVGAFNTPNLECIMAVIDSAEKLGCPVMLTHAEIHESVMPLNVIGPIMVNIAKKATVPVCVHLDHGQTHAYLERAMKLGFTSVMYDGSLQPYEENVRDTKKAVEMAKKYGVSVEGELGILGGRESGSVPSKRKIEDMYTDPDSAKNFVESTGIDAFAASFGTAHGFYKEKPNLDFERIEKINNLIDIPLVMHGGSGVSPEDYKKAITMGIRKINYYSYMARVGVEAAKEILSTKDIQFFPDLALACQNAMEADVEKAMHVFCKK